MFAAPNKLRAFTLAEVLITLAVIGIVAAMAIPSLQTSINDKTYKTAWKKSYSTFSNAAKGIILNYSSLKGLDCTGFIVDTCIKNYFKAELIAAVNEDDSVRGKCWHNADEWKDNLGNLWDLSDGHDACLILNDGSFAVFQGYHSSCPDDVCGNIYVDTNGFKKPNTIGKDIFMLKITPDRITTVPGNCDSTSSGWGCSTTYLYDE